MPKQTEEITPAKPAKGKFGWGAPVLVGAVLAIILNAFFVNIYVVPSASMDPTLKVGDYMVSIPAIDNKEAPERGDIVVFTPPASWKQPEDTIFVKRVVAVGGDTVECCGDDGKLRVNGQPVDESYIKDSNGKKNYKYEVPEGAVFVLGDNRQNSGDSSFYSDPFIPVENIKGQPLQLIYPLNHFKAIN